MKRKNKVLLFLIFLLGVGFSIVSTSLYLKGVTTITTNSSSFDVKFTKAMLDNKNISSSVISGDGKTINFEFNDLSLVGDKSKLDFEVTNDSSMYDAEISVKCSTNGDKTDYYKITNSLNNFISAKTSENGIVEVELLKATVDDIKEEFTCTLSANAVERNSIGKKVYSFKNDSWEKISNNIKNGHANEYTVGDTKEVDMGEFGVHKLRLANTSSCTNDEQGESACGFVVEFAYILTRMQINSSNTNVGGWPASSIRNYINSTVYNALPNELQEIIISTKVVSGHGNTSSESNFISYDKMYLLSSKEVWGVVSAIDATEDDTKQLDYYSSQKVSSSNTVGAIKKYNDTNSNWWLRSPRAGNTSNFYSVSSNGDWPHYGASSIVGISPAFRIS